MPFIPHTPEDVSAMLGAIGATSIEDLFDEIPPALKTGKLKDVPDGLPEMAVTRLMQERASADGFWSNFIGAGVYEHHIPAAIWQITTRGEFYSAYTPYQAEASQGTLQLIYEYQTMMTRLTGLDVSNASLYDGASALAEAVLMAVRAHKTSRRVLVPKSVHPIYRKVVLTTVKNQGIELVELDYDAASGQTVLPADPGAFAGLVIPQPGFFGVLEDVHAMTDWAHAQGALAIGLVNPTTLAVLEAPGKWGTKGADIAVGEGQPLGAPMASGGPYFGFMCCRADGRSRRQAGLLADAAGARAAHPPFQGHLQHLHQPGAGRHRCHPIHGAAGAAGSGESGVGQPRQHGGAGRQADGNPRGDARLRCAVFSRSRAQTQRQRERCAARAAGAGHPWRAGYFRLVSRTRAGNSGLRYRNQDRRRP